MLSVYWEIYFLKPVNVCCAAVGVSGDYLTYKRNRAFDSDGVYPDENYAREIQQLWLGSALSRDQGRPLGSMIPRRCQFLESVQ